MTSSLLAENEGKTTTSANLAMAMAKHGYKVAYVDMDLRKPAVHKIFQSLPREDLMSCLERGCVASLEQIDGLHIFAHSQAVPHADKLIHSDKLVGLLNDLREKMDCVILDSPPYTAVADTGMLLKHADCCVMVVRQDWAPADICRDVIEDLNDSKAVNLGYVLNNYLDDGAEKTFNERYEKHGYYRKNSLD